MNNVGQHLLSGGLSGLASTVILQPFDLLKTRLQQIDGRLKPTQKPGVLRVAREVITVDGVAGLWRGTVPTLFRNVPGVAMYMTTLTQVRSALARTSIFVASPTPGFPTSGKPANGSSNSVLPKLSHPGNLLAGATSRVTIGFLLNPFSVLKARFESDIYRNQYSTFPRALSALIRAGPSELFRGFLPSALRDAPYAGLFVATYEAIKKQTSNALQSNSMISSAGVHTFSAASAGALATLATHPFDVIKTKVQVRQEQRYRGLRSTVATIWTQRGVSGFLDGASLRLSRKVLSSVVGWVVYEGMLLIMQNSNQRAFL